MAHDETRQKIFLLAALALLVLARAPDLLLEPRLWGEEGDTYFQFAWHVEFWEGVLFFERFQGGYFLLAASLPAAIAAHAVPLEWVASVFTYFSLAMMFVPLSIIVFGHSHVWKTVPQRAAACAVVLLAPTTIGEVWLNAINLMSWMGLASLCILMEDLSGASPRRLATLALVLLFAGLSGPYTAFLAPGFAFKLWLERSPGAFVAAGVAGATSLLQVILFAQLAAANELDPLKTQPFDWVRSAVHTLYAQYVVPFVGRDFVHWIVDRAGLDYGMLRGELTWGLAATGLLALAGIVWSVALLAPRSLRSHGTLIALCLVSLSVFTTIGAKAGAAGARYAMLSGIALLWLVLFNAIHASSRARVWACRALLGLALAAGAIGYRSDPAFECRAPCPRWPDEVALWRDDPTYQMNTWPVHTDRPGSRWKVHLRPGEAPPIPGTAVREYKESAESVRRLDE